MRAPSVVNGKRALLLAELLYRSAKLAGLKFRDVRRHVAAVSHALPAPLEKRSKCVELAHRDSRIYGPYVVALKVRRRCDI